MHDVMQVLGKRIVTMIGASLTRQTHAAMQCALESVVPGGRRSHELQWRQWAGAPSLSTIEAATM